MKMSARFSLKFSTLLAAIALVSATVALSSTEAIAGKYKLKCKGPYQIVQGQQIATPPCEEQYLAKVARTYGVKVSVKQIRNNPHKKIELCQFIGHDIRLVGICDGYNDIGPSPGFR